MRAGRLSTPSIARLVVGVMLCLPAWSALAEPALTPQAIEASVVSTGDTQRLRAVMERAQRGERIVLGYFGGSNTAGARSSTPAASFAGLVSRWWQERFPKAKIETVNAGAGGTGSIYGALRAQRDLLSKSPDVVFVEFAINDGWEEVNAEAYEGVLRQILSQPQRPAVLALFMMWAQGGNVQDLHARIGRHYAVPMVSYRDAVWPQVKEGRLQWNDVMADDAHPNDRGHRLAGGLLTARLEATLTSPAARAEPPGALPPPATANRFERVQLRDGGGLVPAEANGWARPPDHTDRWAARHEGARMAVDVDGSAVVISYTSRKGAGSFDVLVDGRRVDTIDTNRTSEWDARLFKVVSLGRARGAAASRRVEVVVATAGSGGAGVEIATIGILLDR